MVDYIHRFLKLELHPVNVFFLDEQEDGFWLTVSPAYPSKVHAIEK